MELKSPNTKTVKFPAENCYEKILKVQTGEALFKVRSKVDACRRLEARSRAHGGSEKCLKVGKKPKERRACYNHQCCWINSMPAKNVPTSLYIASGPGADTRIM